MKYGYARVSPGGKSESVDAQARQLTKAGCKKVFRDVHVSGAKTDRAQLRRLLDQLEAGDVLMVTRLDRLARSTRDLLNTLAAITAKKAGFRSLGDTWADTTTSHGRLMLTVLGGLAEFERDLIRARTGEGRERAKARGVKMGRPPKLTATSAAGGDQAPRPRRGIACRDRAQLQRQRGDDFEIGAVTIPSRPVTRRDVKKFIDYCVILRAFWIHYQTIFEGSDLQHELLQNTAHTFFDDLKRLLIEHLILQICKLTDPEMTTGKRNLTIPFLVNNADFTATLTTVPS